jgi:lysyl-tRNA synthetase class II
LISACPILAKEQYIKRHGRVCAELHFNICKEIGVKLDNKHRYDHEPKSVETSHEVKVTISWNQQCELTELFSTINWKFIIRDYKQRTCMLIDVAVLGDRNVVKEEAEKILKYKDIIEIQRLWNVKAKVISVIITATGTITKSLRQYPDQLTGKARN